MFEYQRNDNGDIFPIIKEMKATTGNYQVGDALVLDSSTGLLKVCTGAVKPKYISCARKVVTAEDNSLSVNPVYEGQEWKTQFSADASDLKEGSAVTINEDGRKVTATTTGGVFTIVHKFGSGGAGTEVIGKFM